MSVEKADWANPPFVDPDLAFFGRLVGGEGVGLVGDAVSGAVRRDVGFGRGADIGIVAGELGKPSVDLVIAEHHATEPTAATLGRMERPVKFEHTRFLGDKRTQLVYDLDSWTDEAVINDIVDSEVGLCFGPDTLVEARNRGYTLATPGKTRRHLKPRA